MTLKNISRRRLILLMIPMLLAPLFLMIASTQITNAALPPRPTVEPVKDKESGAYIELQLFGATVGTSGVWTKVQWVDGFGEWHDVGGWQGTVELDGTQRWWVAEEHMGAGPFRWQVLDGPEGNLLTTSESFMLPDMDGYVLIMPIIIEE